MIHIFRYSCVSAFGVSRLPLGENAPTLDHGNAVAYDDSTATVDNSETLFEANDSFSGTQSADSYPDQDSRTIDTSIEDSFNEEVKNENSVRRVSTTDNSTNVDVADSGNGSINFGATGHDARQRHPGAGDHSDLDGRGFGEVGENIANMTP